MSEKNSKPDLNEDSNVLESHMDLIDASAARSRENHLRENGMEPVSLWVFLACGIALIIGGAVIGKGGSISFKALNHYVLDGYIQADPPGGGVIEIQPKPIIDVFVKNGAKIYQAKCQGCHQSNGLGDGANYPPLGNSEWVTGETAALSQIIMNGVMGPIEVDGRVWNGAMPSQAAGMTASDLAAVMTYIRNSFGNETGDVVSVEMGENAIAKYKERGVAAGPIQVAELESKYNFNLEGEKVDPQVKVNPETLEKIEE